MEKNSYNFQLIIHCRDIFFPLFFFLSPSYSLVRIFHYVRHRIHCSQFILLTYFKRIIQYRQLQKKMNLRFHVIKQMLFFTFTIRIRFCFHIPHFHLKYKWKIFKSIYAVIIACSTHTNSLFFIHPN